VEGSGRGTICTARKLLVPPNDSATAASRRDLVLLERADLPSKLHHWPRIINHALHEPGLGALASRRPVPPHPDAATRRQDAGAPSRARRFMVPMHGRNGEGAFHEPERRTPVRREQTLSSNDCAGPEAGAPIPRFMVPMHAQKRKGALHEPAHEPEVYP